MEPVIIRPKSALTLTYEPTLFVSMSLKTKIMVDVDFTRGSSSGLSMILETSENGSDWYSFATKVMDEDSSTSTIKEMEFIYLATGTPSFELDINKPYARLSVKALVNATGAELGLTVWRL